jgi:lipoprotein-anchoring transpeptidase ErfK/SrfK
VASHAIARGYSDISTFGVSATIPDGVIGAQLAGASGGVLLYSGKDRLDRATWAFLAPRAASLSAAYALGNGSIASSQIAELKGAAAKPWFADGAPGRYVGKRFQVTGWVGGNTTSVAIFLRGRKVRTATVKPWGRFNFTSVPMPVSGAQVYAAASNPDGGSAKTGRSVKRLKYPSATCIVIDKSDFKLYWVKDNRLVRAYPIAVGRASMETPAPATWKILAKYHTSPGSVYGPRKMRLFRQRGSHFVFSAYGIHGTNQPWVIGTKASHGCIRMYNRDVRQLFPQVPLGTMVYTRR